MTSPVATQGSAKRTPSVSYTSWWRRHPMTCFLVLAAVLSWWPWPLYAVGRAPLPIASFGPFLAALVVVAATGGRAGLGAWLRVITRWRVKARWWLVAVAVPVVAAAVAAAVHLAIVPSALSAMALGRWTDLPLSFLAALLIPGFGGAWEEPGWRGWALPRLADRHGTTTASLMLGAVGAMWHLPLILTGLDSWWDLLLVLSSNVVLARLYFAAGRSVWPVMVLHAANNAFSGSFITPMFSGAQADLQAALLAVVWSAIAAGVLIRNRFVLVYLALAYAVSWSILGGYLIARSHGLLAASPKIAITLATLGPAVAALGAAGAEAGRSAFRPIWTSLRRLAAPRWYAVALAGPALGMSLAFGIQVLRGAAVPPAPSAPTWLAMPLLLVALLLPAAAEELGWRGYALPRLQARWGAIPASIFLGIVWAGWHLPIWLIPGTGFEDQSLVAFLVSTVAYSVLLTWLYNRTGGRLTPVILAHASLDASFAPWGAALAAQPAATSGPSPQTSVSLAFAGLAVLVILATRRLTSTSSLTGPAAGGPNTAVVR